MKYKVIYYDKNENPVIQPLEKNKYFIGDILETKKINLSKEQEIHLRLIGLWYIILKELYKQTGNSELYWKRKLKIKAGFFISAKEPDGTVTRELKSVSPSECKLQELSELFSVSIRSIIEDEIIDISQFMQCYFEITGRELIC